MPPLAPAMVSTGSPGAAWTSRKFRTTTASTSPKPWRIRDRMYRKVFMLILLGFGSYRPYSEPGGSDRPPVRDHAPDAHILDRIGRRIHRVGLQHREVGPLARLDRADFPVEPERVGCPQRDRPQRVRHADALA